MLILECFGWNLKYLKPALLISLIYKHDWTQKRRTRIYGQNLWVNREIQWNARLHEINPQTSLNWRPPNWRQKLAFSGLQKLCGKSKNFLENHWNPREKRRIESCFKRNLKTSGTDQKIEKSYRKRAKWNLPGNNQNSWWETHSLSFWHRFTSLLP